MGTPARHTERRTASTLPLEATMDNLPGVSMPATKYALLPTWVFILLSIFLPPLAVFFLKDVGMELVINIVLSVLFWVPGVLHALYVTYTTKMGNALSL